MVRISDELMARIDHAVREGRYASAEDVVSVGVDLALRQPRGNAVADDFDLDAIPYDPDWKPSPEVQRLIDECVGNDDDDDDDKAWEARFAEFREKWKAMQK